MILGGGFGGLYAARSLARADADVLLIDRRNHHLFQPLLYQVATAALNPSDIAVPIRAILRRQHNTQVIMAEATAIDVARRVVVLADGEEPYDHLIVATGATHSYFGHDEWAPFAPGLKTIEDATEIRRRLLTAFEEAEREPDEARRRAWLTFVIVGGGPTGVELAGALAEVARHTLARDFDRIDPREARVVVVEGQPHVLPTLAAPLPERADEQLEALRVELRLGKRVTAIDADGVTLEPGERIAARTVLWAAGVAASPLARSLGVPLDRAGRVAVAPDLSVPGHPEIFVAGDLAVLQQDGKPVTGLAPIAIQEGRHAAANVMRRLEGRPTIPFRYFDKGVFATIGRGKAVGDVFGRWKLDGFLAWIGWLSIHLFFLIGFRNRVAVMLGWAYSYLTWRRGARLITGAGAASAPGARAATRADDHVGSTS